MTPDDNTVNAKSCRERKGIIEDVFSRFMKKCSKRGYFELEDVIYLINLMRANEMDCHVVIAGQNGLGKSHTLLMLKKKKRLLTIDWILKNILLLMKGRMIGLNLL